ncbi:MAG: DUF4381 domain-containing protein [Gammaproteobacteria bacterium]|nr:DUF4381 domain-containing protein [Gammaproteobacteria bacterium]MCZ6856108.1 DUF4381 domain-containing protein [Gammaproteobacteria bacterium]
MEADPLAQLRDIHLPLDPSWWPPAPGWWLLIFGTIALLWFATRYTHDWFITRRPLKRARKLYEDLYGEFCNQTLSKAIFVHESNEILKRLMIHSFNIADAPAANDQRWLALLDARYGGTEFTQGPGQALGNDRFRPHPQADIEQLHPLLERFFSQVKP